MWRLIKALFKFLVFIAVLLCIGWFGLKYYFNYVNKINNQVRNDVANSVQAKHENYLTYDEIPKMYRNAIIATEDRRFFTNIGVDIKGTLRAAYVDLRSGKPLQGGSTITQQLVDNTLLSTSGPKTMKWKLTESIYAIGIYDTISKRETFELYTNVIYYGHGAYGLYQAAETYFGKAPGELNDGELTMLAGLPNAPSVYDPYSNMKLARERQQIVVQSMVDSGIISEFEAQQTLSQPIELK